jgi:hypothetical protein
VRSVLILRTSCRSLILSEGKLRFRNWSRGRLSPFVSAEAVEEAIDWVVKALPGVREAAEAGDEEGAESEGRVLRGVTANGGGKHDAVAPPDEVGCDSRVEAGLGAAAPCPA